MFKRLAHVCIGANDLAESEHFYCELLGMEKVFDFIKDNEAIGFYAKVGEMTFIEVFVQGETANLERPIMKHFCLEVEDIDVAVEAIKSKGIEITEKLYAPDNSWQAWITDPSGVQIELMQYTASSSQLNGNPVILD